MTETPGAVDFAGFVSGLVASAAAMLAEVESLVQGDAGDAGGGAAGSEAGGEEGSTPSPEEVTEAIDGGLRTVRHLIDTLAMLQEKTRGNLTQQEGDLVQTALTELRLVYLRVADRPPPGAGGEAAG